MAVCIINAAGLYGLNPVTMASDCIPVRRFYISGPQTIRLYEYEVEKGVLYLEQRE